jgi:hypothetical protein
MIERPVKISAHADAAFDMACVRSGVTGELIGFKRIIEALGIE